MSTQITFDDRSKEQYEAIKWMFEMEVLDDPSVIHTIKANVLGSFDRVVDLEYVYIGESRKQLLMYLEIKPFWFFNKRRTGLIEEDTLEIMQALLPNFTIRVVSDREIFEASLQNIRDYVLGLEGGTSNG